MMQGRRRNRRWLIGGGIIALGLAVLAKLNLGENLVYFYTPSEAQAKAAELQGKTIKVGGLVQTVTRKPEGLELDFLLTDNQGHDIVVTHRGTPPDMFKEHQGVVVEGRIGSDGRTMMSQNLMVKHSEEYKKPDDHSKMDRALLERSLFKGEASLP